MTIQMNRLLAHMSWANQLTIEHLEKMSDEALEAYSINPEWTVGEILNHIVSAADFYVFRLTGIWTFDPKEFDNRPKRIADLPRLREQALKIDKALLDCVGLEDVQVEFKNRAGDLVKRWRSTILSQAIHHATEHRAQLSSALEVRGLKAVDLDELDLWSFEINNH
jgi:uncharacterized damage-inducible protein DinB